MAGEELDVFADRHPQFHQAFDAVFSNFAALNCIPDLTSVLRGMARVVKPGGCAILVLFGTFSPGEIITEFLRGRPGQSLRRLSRNPVPARVGGHQFAVTYHRGKSLRRAMQPWFRMERRAGIGVFVPPSAAEPWISNHRWLL
jgi:SAM-dependent methyltransferase